ncbi:mannitol dehydrogenase [Gluconacetobacter liquefaciens]|uniref:Mannitol 2-dehydrogenase n=1 Tax=Gluconacetobacter liquefaciens TaxID=89584 RepID=A0A370FVR6_GLULI|nr:mannitol dehydrogenase family protein [Gluconacetobacter liquefaciens]MBB2187365.1 mannitol dehydrogenase family protein [Gluconacetobacter liquefaciens]RDI35478.1 mannitol 2-dehydrogenase [Gluconacetobacter liquefaciens]GBQ96949.1 NADPH-dependent L-sorbose reductase [Gluconacetobacter liquefaciens NRIC 0522]GEB38991.1 mannitol dehydrogenase [Gluconacetobacter liquefaciens]
MTILSPFGAVPPAVLVPSYDRAAVRPGIAHLSVGNFHRAHQAVYIDRVLARPGNAQWGILGIGVMDDAHERAKAESLLAQHGLYTLTECPADAPDSVRFVGSIVEYLHAPDDRAAAIHRLADPAIRIVSLTVTEGGYYIDADGRFQLDHPAIAEDLARPVPHTVFGLVTEALRLRRDAGTGPFTILSCDNLPHNGHVARTAFLTWARARDAVLADWIEAHVTFPSTMVDRITPGVGPLDITRLDTGSGVDDRVPVFCEDFIQWVIEDKFCAGRPPLEEVGVLFTGDVTPYEQVKLRMLNASHSMLGLPGMLMGYRVVSDIMHNPDVVALLEHYLAQDAEPLLQAPPGMELRAYAAQLLRRFSNVAISDQLPRIASDSASKLPVFVRPTAEGTLARGADAARIAFLLSCFAEYLRGHDDTGATYELQEPHLSPEDLALAADEDPAKALDMSVFAGWGLRDHPTFVDLFTQTRTFLRAGGTRACLRALVSPPESAPGI